MKIDILCSDPRHPIQPLLQAWAAGHARDHEVRVLGSRTELAGGDILFLVSVSEIIRLDIRSRYRATLVLHASALPEGRGWSPHVWQVVEGRKRLTVTLLAAEDAVDTGAIWAQRSFELAGHELWDEINARLFAAELALMDTAVEGFGRIEPQAQAADQASYYRKRTPEDSRIDPDKSIAEQFDLLRIADPLRYPAFFDLRGQRYRIVLEKIDDAGQ